MTSVVKPAGDEQAESAVALESCLAVFRREAGTHLPCGGVEIDFNHRGFDGDCDVDSDAAHEGIGHPARSRRHWSGGDF